MIRSAKLCDAALAAFAVLSCASQAGPHFATASALPEERRRAPGIALDPELAMPRARERAPSDAPLVVLRAPYDRALPKATVQRFFDAIIHEDEAELGTLLLDDASVQSGSQGSRQSARGFWQTRFARLDYAELAENPVRDPGALEIYGAADAPLMKLARNLPLIPEQDDVLIRARIARTHVGKTRVFGDEIVFLLSPRADGYKIGLMLEDFSLP